MVGVDAPASYLRDARRAAGLTQEQLAAAAGVHVRTVRNLESARVEAPRRSTLERIASALQVPSAQRAKFLSRWIAVAEEALGTDRLFAASDPDLSLLARATMASQSLLSLSEVVSIGADRQVVQWQTEEVIQARVDRVRRRTVFFELDDPAVDLDRFHLSHLENCTVLEVAAFTAARYRVFQLEFDRTLNRGDSQIVRYRADFATSYQGSNSSPRPRDEVIGGFFRPPKSYVLEVRFDPSVVPASVRQVFRSTPTSPTRTITNLALNGNARTHLALVEPRPGAHGVSWTW